MKIAYVRNTFPKNSETFILEEILHLKRAGHDIRIFAKWCDHTNLNDKITENGLLSSVIYSDLNNIAFKHRFRLFKKFLGRWFGSSATRSLFVRNFFEGRNVRAVARAAIEHQCAGLSWKKALKLRYQAFATFCLTAMRLDNISLAYHQIVLRYEGFEPELVHCPFLFFPDVLMVRKLLARFPKLPLTVTLRSRDVYFRSDNQAYIDRRDWAIERATQVFTISQYNKRELSSRFALQREMQIVHSSIDVQLFTPSPEAMKIPNQVLCVARLVPKKGLEVLIDACAVLNAAGREFSLSIVGEGVLKEALQAKIERQGLQHKVRIEGPFGQKKIKELLDAAEVFVLPCVVAPDGDRDMLPNSIKEAMAMQLPVVTTNISGIEELITDGLNGLLTRPNDPQDLADKIALAISDREFAKRAGEAARAHIMANFSIASEGAKFNAALEGIVASRTGKPISAPGAEPIHPSY